MHHVRWWLVALVRGAARRPAFARGPDGGQPRVSRRVVRLLRDARGDRGARLRHRGHRRLGGPGARGDAAGGASGLAGRARRGPPHGGRHGAGAVRVDRRPGRGRRGTHRDLHRRHDGGARGPRLCHRRAGAHGRRDAGALRGDPPAAATRADPRRDRPVRSHRSAHRGTARVDRRGHAVVIVARLHPPRRPRARHPVVDGDARRPEREPLPAALLDGRWRVAVARGHQRQPAR